MSDKIIEPIIKEFTQNSVIGKIIIAFTFIVVMIFLVLTYWSNKQSEKMLNQLTIQNSNVESLIENQTQIDIFKQCVNEQHESAMKTFNNKFIIKLGKVLLEYNVPFPQELNETIYEFRQEMADLKDCLICLNE